jgi:hypothetical protein
MPLLTRALILLTLLAAGPLAAQANASHFRGGNINWQKAAGSNDVTFENTQAWARTSQTGTGADGAPVVGDVIENSEGCITPGDTGSQVCPQYLVTEANVQENWIVVRALAPGTTDNFRVPYTYDGSGTVFTASTSSCCTISEFSNAPDSSWNVNSQVNLGDGGAPRSSVPPIVDLPPNSGVHTFSVAAVPGSYPGPHGVRYRLSNPTEACADSCTDPQPPTFGVDPNTGVASFDTTGRSGLWFAGVVLETVDGGGTVISTSQAQFVIRVGGAPDWTGPTPADGTAFLATPDSELAIDLEVSDPDVNDQLTISQTSGPGFLSQSEFGNPGRARWSYTPSTDELGTEHTVTFEAVEQGPIPHAAPTRTYRIQVAQPQRGVSANAVPKGTVRVKLPAGSAGDKRFKWARDAGAGGFIPLDQARQIPIGSVLDTRKGQVSLTLARNATATKTQTANFRKGTFKLKQGSKNALTTLTMRGGLGACKTQRGRKTDVSAAGRRSRRLLGRGRGRFRTRGRNSSATVRGTKWLHKDTCRGTLTVVREGTVVVRDFVKKRNVVLKKGKRNRYLARSQKRR